MDGWKRNRRGKAKEESFLLVFLFFPFRFFFIDAIGMEPYEFCLSSFSIHFVWIFVTFYRMFSQWQNGIWIFMTKQLQAIIRSVRPYKTIPKQKLQRKGKNKKNISVTRNKNSFSLIGYSLLNTKWLLICSSISGYSLFRLVFYFSTLVSQEVDDRFDTKSVAEYQIKKKMK